MPDEKTAPEIVEVARLRRFVGDSEDPADLIQEIVITNGQITEVNEGPAEDPDDTITISTE